MPCCAMPRSCIRAGKAPVGGVRGLKPLTVRTPRSRAAPRRVTRMTSSAAAEVAEMPEMPEVPDMDKRATMNLILLGSAASVTLGLAGPFLGFFVPKGSSGGGGAQAAKDQQGNDIRASEWVETHHPGDRSLAQGLKGDPTYLIVTKDKAIETFGINAVCTHMQCVVPWENAENKFKCPCHGSQYDAQGKVIRGPAPLPLELAHADVAEDGIVQFSPWTENDFRTDAAPWWK